MSTEKKLVNFTIGGMSRPTYMSMDADRYERLIAGPCRMLDNLNIDEIDFEELDKEIDRKRKLYKQRKEV